MTSTDRHADRTRKRLERRGENGIVILTYASARTARKAEAAMNTRHPNVYTASDLTRSRVVYAFHPVDANGRPR